MNRVRPNVILKEMRKSKGGWGAAHTKCLESVSVRSAKCCLRTRRHNMTDAIKVPADSGSGGEEQGGVTGAHCGEEETPPGGALQQECFCLNTILTVNTYKYTLKHLVHGF